MRVAVCMACAAVSAAVWGGGLDAEGFVRDWLVSGPYPNYRNADGSTRGLAMDFLADEGGEAYVFPRAGDRRTVEFLADKSKLIAGIGSVNEWGRTETFVADATWRPLSSPAGIINTDGLFPAVEDYFVAYAVCYFKAPSAMDVKIAVGSDDYHKIWLNDRQIGSRNTSQAVVPQNFVYAARVRKGWNKLLFKLVEVTQGSGFCVQLLDAQLRPVSGIVIDNALSGKALSEFEKSLHPPRPVAVVAKENAELEAAISRLKKTRLPELERKVADLAVAKGNARKRLNEAFKAAERRFAAIREGNLADAPNSSDRPLGGKETRRKLCLNGDWSGSADGGKTWESVRVPLMVSGHYFLGWHNPIVKEDPKNPWSKARPMKGWEDWRLSPLSVADNFRKRPALYRTAFAWDGEGGVDFVSEGIQGSAKVYCNGVPCGTYDGNIGIVRMPLAGLRRGQNVLTVEFGLMRTGQHSRDGLLGDVYVEYLPETRVDGVQINTSWERAEITVRAELSNRTGKAATVEVRPKVVERGRVRLELPSVRVKLEAGKTAFVGSRSKWADPKPWGPGGKYGNPDLYELVSDVYEDGRLVDRHRETFGFREFRIFHTDFFLNGKRIVLQGDTGHTAFEDKRVRDIAWNIYREDGVNIIRTHDGAYWSVPAVADADKVGMLMYVQMYPLLFPQHMSYDKAKKLPIIPPEEWVKREEHRWNLANYARWWKTFRNHPSVVIWSTDNEVLTQAWDTAADADFNVRNEKVAALYEKYVKSLDPTCVMTRNGDLSTQNHKQRWFEVPPCDTANYHYPDFNIAGQVVNWRKTYEWRPAVFGETLYCSYGQWDGWPGPVPSQVAKKAERVRRVVGIYREEEVPCAVFMGVGLDSYAQEDDTGKGNPWGITKRQKDAFAKDGTPIPGFGPRDYPWAEIKWPSLSGRGLRPVAKRLNYWYYTCELINAYDPKRPAVARNAVAKAYRDTLLPQPALRNGPDAEALVKGAAPYEDVWAAGPEGYMLGVRADADGTAWFREIAPGDYTFTAGGERLCATLAPRGDAALKPGFEGVPTLHFNKKHEGENEMTIKSLLAAGAVAAAVQMPAAPKAQLVPGDLAVRDLEVGACLFRDRTFVLRELPDQLKGLVFLAGPFADEPSVRAEVARGGVLTVLSPESGPVSQAKLLMEQGFAVDESISAFQTWGKWAIDRARVWRKEVKKGERITFGKWAILCGFDASNMHVERPTAKNRELVARLKGELTREEVIDVNVTSPDYAVFIPPNPGKRQERVKAVTHDIYNDHFQVIYDERRKCHYAFWTQATREPMADHHTAFRKSVDGGRTWSPLKVLAGSMSTNRADLAKNPGASWQQPMLAKTGRLYVLWGRSTDHLMGGRYSDDGGETWSEPDIVDFDPRTPREVASGAGRASWWCNWQRPLRLGPEGHFLVGSSRGDDGLEFWEFPNIDDNPDIKNVKVLVHNTGDKALKVPFRNERGRCICEEASIMKLPDGRLFAVMRATGGAAVWSVSSDQGRNWTQPEQLRTKDGGELIRHSVSPCPCYDWKGCEAGSGLYFGLFHLEVTDHRGPLFFVPGKFNPTAHQPVEFTGRPKLFEPRSHWNSFYTSYTTAPDGTGTLWYPDAAKFYLLGRDIMSNLMTW